MFGAASSGGGLDGGLGPVDSTEKQRRDLVQGVGSLMEVRGALLVVHDREAVLGLRARKAHGVHDPDSGVVLPAIFVARLISRACPPHAPLLDRSDPLHAARHVTTDSG